MRTFAFAALLFAAGFGTVSIGQQASAYLSHNRVILKLTRQAAGPAPRQRDMKQHMTFTDYLIVANRAFAAMDRSCSEADRAALGKAFHELVSAARQLQNGRLEVGRRESAKTDLGFTLTRLKIYSQVMDASRRGILKGRHFPFGAARLMHVRTKAVEIYRTSRCPPV